MMEEGEVLLRIVRAVGDVLATSQSPGRLADDLSSALATGFGVVEMAIWVAAPQGWRRLRTSPVDSGDLAVPMALDSVLLDAACEQPVCLHTADSAAVPSVLGAGGSIHLHPLRAWGKTVGVIGAACEASHSHAVRSAIALVAPSIAAALEAAGLGGAGEDADAADRAKHALERRPAGALDFRRTLETAVGGTERALIERALHVTRNNRTQAARLLGIGRRTLLYKLKRYGISERAASS
jgi:hypothetical protein